MIKGFKDKTNKNDRERTNGKRKIYPTQSKGVGLIAMKNWDASETTRLDKEDDELFACNILLYLVQVASMHPANLKDKPKLVEN